MKFELSPELCKALDEISQSPNEIAEEVFAQMKEKLPDFTNLQVVAFCIEYLAGQSITDMPFFADEVKALARLFYTAHYYNIWRTLEQEEMQKVITTVGRLKGLSNSSLQQTEKPSPKKIQEL